MMVTVDAQERDASPDRAEADRDDSTTLTLESMLTREAISIGLSATDWREAVRGAGELLVRSGGVQPRYVDAMIDMVEEIGPYIVIAPGVALPHARPEDGAIKTCMSLVTLDPPVDFGNEHNDPVHTVIAFATSDSHAHTVALAQLAKRLGDSALVDGLSDACSPQDVLELLRAEG